MNKNDVFQTLKQTLKNSYSPYSKFAVSACLKSKKTESLFTGANIENASYGATVCAERVALWSAIHQLGPKIDAEWLALTTQTKKPSRPCGLCLQVMSEFLSLTTPIHCFSQKGRCETFTLSELLPHPFNDLN